jgi:hypothetical protein
MDVEKLNIKTRLEGRLIRGSRRDRYSRRPLPRTLSPVSDADLLLRLTALLGYNAYLDLLAIAAGH